MAGIAEPALRFLHYAALLGLFGWTAFRLIGLRGLDRLPFERGAPVLIGATIAAPLLSTALMLTSIAAMMGVPSIALDRAMVEAMILTTDMGCAFLARLALLLAALLALLMRNRTNAARPVAAACFAGALMTLGWSGHAAATAGGLGLFHRVNNGIHLLAAGLWFGAIGWFLYLTAKARRRSTSVPAEPLLAATHRFAPLGVALVAIVAITGLINTQLIFGLENSQSVVKTDYGVLLVAKIALVGGMLGFASHNAWIGRSYAVADDATITDPSIALSRLPRSLVGEIVLTVGIIGLVAVLGMWSPMM